MYLPRKVLFCAAAGVGLFLVQPGSAQNPDPNPKSQTAKNSKTSSSRNQSSSLSAQDRKFMMDAAKGGMMEVHMGKLAMERGSSPAVKSYGQRLVDDHTKANEELMALAKQKGVNLPPDNPNAVPRSLTSKTGPDFDKAFAKMAIDDHEKDIKEFEMEANSGSDPDVKAWANKTLPTLRAHLDAAKALNK